MAASTAYLLIACAFVVGFVLGRTRAPERLGQPAAVEGDALEAVRSILERDGKIAAIKAYRQRTGVGLRDAKAAVDSIED